MKKYLITIIAIFISLTSILAQSPEKFSFQTILKDSNGDAIANQNVTLNVSILLDTDDGTEVFSETHTLTTNETGLVNLKIGSIEDLSAVNWNQGKHFLKITMDNNIIENKELLSVPFSQQSKQSAFANIVNYENLSNLPDWDKNKNDDFDGLFNSLLMWSEENSNLYYNKGKVSIQGPEPESFQGEVLRVNGAILYNGGTTDTIPGILYYDPSGNGSFRYFDNTGTMKVIGTGIITFNDPDPIAGDVIINSDTEWKNRVCLGNGAYPGYDFGENVFILADDTLRIYFFDTSNSGSFPSVDWQMVFNDLQNGGDNYFAVFDSINHTTPFKIMAGTINQSLFIDENSNTGIGTSLPSEKLDVNGNVTAEHLIGDGSELTGITGATGSIENTGSTTIGADIDADNTGQIIFQTQGTVKLIIDNNGNVKMGSSAPIVEFDASDKDAKFNAVEVSENIAFGAVAFWVVNETDPGANSFTYDVAHKKTIIFDSSIGALTINGFQNGIPGQKITIINKGTSPIVLTSFSGSQWIFNPGFVSYTLNQYESASYVFNNYWYCQELVKAP